MNKCIMLIGFYNQKALGIRYLEKALKSAGYKVYVVFFKGFDSVKPGKASSIELKLLKDIVSAAEPELIGLSVMTSFYLETVIAVNKLLKNNFQIPLVWGGVFPTLFPERCLEFADFVVRGEGEEAIVELCEAVLSKSDFAGIKNLAYKEDEKLVINDLRALEEIPDRYGYPEIGGNDKYFIENGFILMGDPQLNSICYELSTSRGCPFMCSYCCSANIHRLYSGKGSYVRFRSVSSVIAELADARNKINGLKYIHFWDEIFPDDEKWVDDFAKLYSAEISLPFEIWAHPLKVGKNTISKLVEAGLYKIVAGIQSGSPYIRKEIFNRTEKQSEIIAASKVLEECKVPQVIYDFMLQHPFESESDIIKTFELCMQLKPPFGLQLHGLNFLPGTDIVDTALKMHIKTRSEIDKIIDGGMQRQFDEYWGRRGTDAIHNFWYSLIFLTQFSITRPVTKFFAKNAHSVITRRLAVKLFQMARPFARMKYLHKRIFMILRYWHMNMRSYVIKKLLVRPQDP